MFGLQYHRVVLCKWAPLLPLTYTTGERYRAVWALLFSDSPIRVFVVYQRNAVNAQHSMPGLDWVSWCWM